MICYNKNLFFEGEYGGIALYCTHYTLLPHDMLTGLQYIFKEEYGGGICLYTLLQAGLGDHCLPTNEGAGSDWTHHSLMARNIITKPAISIFLAVFFLPATSWHCKIKNTYFRSTVQSYNLW